MANSEVKRVLPPLPEYELPSYEPVEVVKPVYPINDDMVEAKIKSIMDEAPKDYEETKRKVAGPKETVKIQIEVTRDGEPIESLCSDGQIYVIGQGYMPIGFDRNVVGINVDEEREFDFDAPDFDDPEHKERSFHAKVKLLAILREKEPELTDEWVKSHIMLCSDVEAFRKRTRNNLEKEAEKLAQQELTERAASALAARFKGRIDDVWYEESRDDMVRTYEEQAKSQGTTLEDMIKAQGMDQQQFNMMVMLQVREMLQQGFSLDAWARHYGLEATEEDVVAVASLMSGGRGKMMIESLREAGEEEQLKGLEIAARRYIANKDVLEKAIIKEA